MTLMWEVRAADGRDDDLVAWALEHASPDAQVYRAADGRVVVIDETETGLPDVPTELISRPPHSWRFTPVLRPNR